MTKSLIDVILTICFPGVVSQEKLKSVQTSDKMGVFKESKACTPSKPWLCDCNLSINVIIECFTLDHLDFLSSSAGSTGLMLVPCMMLLSVMSTGVYLLGFLGHQMDLSVISQHCLHFTLINQDMFSSTPRMWQMIKTATQTLKNIPRFITLHTYILKRK